jgi:hypothetical protein
MEDLAQHFTEATYFPWSLPHSDSSSEPALCPQANPENFSLRRPFKGEHSNKSNFLEPGLLSLK